MTRSTHPFEPEEVMAYLDGELTPERAAAAAAHLEQCGECRALTAEMRSVSKQMLAWQVESSPERLAESVHAAVETKEKNPEPVKTKSAFRLWPERPRFRMMMWGLSACAALLLLFAISIPNLLRSGISVQRAHENATGLSSYSDRESARATDARGRESRAMENKSIVNLPLNGRAAAAPASEAGGGGGSVGRLEESELSTGPMIVRNATVAIVVKNFDSGREAMENLLRAHHGYAANLSVSSPQNAGRSLTATLQVPAGELDAVLAELKKLGRVEQESQAAEEVTRQYVDLTARLKNSRETEQRLIQVLRERTGKVKDVLEVEQEIARVRGEIEQMDAERKNLDRQVRYAALQLKLSEEYQATLETPRPSAATRLGNAVVEGIGDAIESGISFLVFFLGVAPWLALWTLLLFWPARLAWRRARGLMAR